MLRFSTYAIIALGMAACAPNSHAAETVSSPQMARIQQACTVDMGLNASEAPYDSCVASLKETLTNINQRDVIARGRQSCAAQGLKPATPEFAECVLAAESSL